MAWYSGDVFEKGHDDEPRFRPLRLGFLVADDCSIVVIPQLLWSRKVRTQRRRALSSSRYPSISACGSSVSSSSCKACTGISCPRVGECIYPTIWDWATLLGSIGLFLTLQFLFIRYMPMISMSESRELDRATKGGATVKPPSARAWHFPPSAPTSAEERWDSFDVRIFNSLWAGVPCCARSRDALRIRTIEFGPPF